MLIDTHCHLDAPAFEADRPEVIARAVEAGVGRIVIPAVAASNFRRVQSLARALPGGAYALGIHPLFVDEARDEDLSFLEECLAEASGDPALVAVGEIGLDFFVPAMRAPDMRARQEHFYRRQLDIAARFGLPVLLHVRRSQDELLKYLRRQPIIGGIAHAFNGSFQQAEQFMALGFALGMGGAMTFSRARRIRRLATMLPLEALVLETDAPDMAPAWLAGPGLPKARNEPAEVSGVADCLAQLRGIDRADVLRRTAAAAHRVLPRLAMDSPI